MFLKNFCIEYNSFCETVNGTVNCTNSVEKLKMSFLAPDHLWCPVAGCSIKEEEGKLEWNFNENIFWKFIS